MQQSTAAQSFSVFLFALQSVRDGSPAKAAGLQPEDIIVSLDGEFFILFCFGACENSRTVE